MSYHVELAQEEHELVLRETLKNWSLQDHDIQLLSTEGYRIIAHKKILSFYSRQLKNLLNEPEIAFGSQIPTLSLPASSTCISSLLSILVTGKAEKASLQEVKQLATTLGIKLKNCLVDKKSNLNKLSGISVIKVPENVGRNQPNIGNNSIQKPIIRVESLQNKSSISTVNSSGSIHSLKKQLEKVGSGLRIEMKGMKDVHKLAKNENQENIIKKAKCIDCGNVFKDIDYLNKHRENKHGDPSKDQIITENAVEQVKCDVCNKMLSVHSIRKHRFRKHGLRKRQKMPEIGSVEQMKRETTEDEDDGDRNVIVECDVCQKQLKRKSLRKHRRNIHGLRKGQMMPAFKNGHEMNKTNFNNLKKHKKTFKCDNCMKSFGNGWLLRQHQKTHLPDSEKPYECDICHKKFCQKGQRKIHLKNIHNFEESMEPQNISEASQRVSESIMLDTADDSDIKPSLDESVFTVTPFHYDCSYCEDQFANEEELNNHVASTHV